MSPAWPANSHMKIHEVCGGIVRWVEAYDDPGVGFTGECLECGADGIVVERIIPVEVPPGETGLDVYNECDIADLRRLAWDDDAAFDVNQRRISEKIGMEVPRP